MNTAVTSREQILKAAKELALSDGGGKISMRAVAVRCGIAVGSIYNYFPTKTDLTIAVVAEVWQEIFSPSRRTDQKGDFLGYVMELCACIQDGMKTYPRFFADHALVVADKSKGRTMMEEYARRMRDALLKSLLADPKVRPDIWADAFTPEAFAAFIFDFLRADLMQGRSRREFLCTLILRAIY